MAGPALPPTTPKDGAPVRVQIVSPKGNVADQMPVVLKGLDIPFWDLVALMVKLAFASIPAALIFAIPAFVIGACFEAMKHTP